MAPEPNDPEDTSAALALAVGAAAVGIFRLAKRSGLTRMLSRALQQQSSGDPVALLAAGQAALGSSRYHEAAAHCEAAAAAVDPAVPGADDLRAAALVGLGLAWYHLGDPDASRAAFAEAHRVQPASPYPLANLARLAAAEGRFDEMRELLEQAVPLIHPQDHYLVAKLTSEEVFAAHLDEVLELLVAHHLLTPHEYARSLRAWQQGTLELAPQDITVNHVNVAGTVGAFAVGPHSSIDRATVDLEQPHHAPHDTGKASMTDNRGDRRADFSGTVGAFTMGDNSAVSNVHVTHQAIAHPHADEIAQLLEQIRTALDAGDMAGFAKRDVQHSLDELEGELRRPDTEERRSGLAHWVRRIADAVHDSGAIDLVRSLATLLGVGGIG